MLALPGGRGLDVHVASREYQATSPGESDELTTPYLADGKLDLSAWAHDAVALALPDKILCREDCAGLCPVCGKDLNREPHEHEDDDVDPRWAALADLKRPTLETPAGSYTQPPRWPFRSERPPSRAATSGGRTHKASVPALVECPQCHQPKRPHHVCPTCGTYRGREVEPLRTSAP